MDKRSVSKLLNDSGIKVSEGRINISDIDKAVSIISADSTVSNNLSKGIFYCDNCNREEEGSITPEEIDDSFDDNGTTVNILKDSCTYCNGDLLFISNK